MANPGFTKTYDAGAAIAPYTIVKFSGDFVVVPGAAATDALIGVTTEIAANQGERADVVHGGTPFVQLGGTVAGGDLLTSDANGHAITAAPASGAVASVIGRARYSGVSGDVIEFIFAPGQIHG
ncbi:capsid cement protein [Ralstonia insidiosa]|uniref:DUF2190 family protein n=1 Tax=Ralstonia insidiosa TaxID=190721 RepID=A0A848NVL8_9RALS|nr:capsid cement protein [Ralstonia insidiosa]NMV37237.1 DUF2190 family protein [Ralstonia insidiosa]